MSRSRRRTGNLAVSVRATPEGARVRMGLPFRILPSPGLLTLSMVAAALVGVIGFELHHGVPGTTEPATPASQQSEAPAVSRSDNIPSDQAARYAETILARPLFSPTRRPEAADTVTHLPRLAGTIVSPGGNSAIFTAPTKGKPVVVGEGGRVGEYVVRLIEVGTVTIVGPGGQHILHPTFDPKPPRVVATARPTSGPTPSAKPEIPPALVAQFKQATREYRAQRRGQ